MPLKPYKPALNVLHIGNSESQGTFSKLLFKQNIYAYPVATISDAGKILKTHVVDIVLFDPVSQSLEEKDFTALARLIKIHHALFIAWSDLEAARDFCRKEKILIFGKGGVESEGMAEAISL